MREDEALFEYRHQFVVLAKTKDSTMYTLERQNHLKTIWYQVKQQGESRGLSVSAGISGMVPVERMASGYETALQALHYRFLNGPGSCKILDRTVRQKTEELRLPPDYETGLKKHDLQGLLDAIDSLRDELLKKEITDRKLVKNLMMNGIVRLAQEMGQHTDCGQMWEKAGDLEECLEIWKEQCRRIVSAYEESRNANYSVNIRKALAYIHEHYGSDILVEEVAAHIGKTPNYFSSIFRTEVGMTFREYLNHYRIERARELIEESDMMIYEIAERVGYSDYTYFSQVFKKVTGISPTSLRGRTKQEIS